jgi:hypothetical protein
LGIFRGARGHVKVIGLEVIGFSDSCQFWVFQKTFKETFNFKKTILGGSWVGVFQRIKETPVLVISKTLKNSYFLRTKLVNIPNTNSLNVLKIDE